MNTVFEVTDLGLQLDGRMLLPGTRLIVKNNPHPSWLDVGHVAGEVTERRLVVASPAAEPEHARASAEVEAQVEAAVFGADIADIRTQYEQATGRKPHYKMKAESMLAEINKRTTTSE